MSYDIYIGEAVPDFGQPEDGDEAQIKMVVAQVEQPEAPEWPSPDDGSWPDISGKQNGRHPGYIQMRDFCERVGLADLFFNEATGFLRPRNPSAL